MAPEVLANLDLVLAAFHSALRTVEDQTERYLAAIVNPNVHILGHPRGRIYNYRLGLKADWDRVFEEAARLGKAVEIDCYPDRQDLSFDLVQRARKAEVLISLGTDAHHPWQLEFIEFGLAAALAAKIPKDRILNFKPVNALLDWTGLVREQGKKIRTKAICAHFATKLLMGAPLWSVVFTASYREVKTGFSASLRQNAALLMSHPVSVEKHRSA